MFVVWYVVGCMVVIVGIGEVGMVKIVILICCVVELGVDVVLVVMFYYVCFI